QEVAEMPPGSVDRLLSAVDSLFPKRGEFTGTKRRLFGPPDERTLLASAREPEVLTALATQPAARCLAIPDMQVDQRAARYYRRDPRAAVGVIVAGPEFPTSDLARAYVQ